MRIIKINIFSFRVIIYFVVIFHAAWPAFSNPAPCSNHICWPVKYFLARGDVIYTSYAYATMSVSVCLSVCL